MSQQVKVTKSIDFQTTGGFKGMAVQEKTANYTMTTDDSGKITVMNTANNRIFTLPAVADCKGLCFIMINTNTGTMTVTGGTADKMVCLNDAAAKSVGYATANQIIGAACMVIGDGSLYYFFDLGKATETITA